MVPAVRSPGPAPKPPIRFPKNAALWSSLDPRRISREPVKLGQQLRSVRELKINRQISPV